MIRSQEVRQKFMDFFAERGHRIVPSAPVVPHGDPTLMFTNAGMNQFKDVFLGTGSRDYTRCANTQKCIRVSGKHNDLEEVGVDTYHHTFFEMLGNWSFGDYFKREAIRWGWAFLTEWMGLDGDRLWATVFGGDEKLGLEPDLEAEQIWPAESGIAADRVLRFGVDDNFWEMAETGPCGPCSEIHMDLGPEACDKKGVAGHVCAVNGGCARYIEVWNLVFIQYNRFDRRTLRPLPARHVDTGMGFERLVAVCRGSTSNYDTDLFVPMLDRIGELTGVRYGEDERTDVAMRVVSDHVRALSVAIADGALPSNKDRGYVLRRLLRRASRFGYQVLGEEHPFVYKLVPVVAEVFGSVFPEIGQRTDHISRVVESEEQAFLRTLERGITRFYALSDGLAKKAAKGTEPGNVIDGAQAFDLYSTYGFPKDLIELMARERGLSVDGSTWEKAEAAHKLASAAGQEGQFDVSELEGLEATEFVGYWERQGAEELGTRAEARILKLVDNQYLVLDRTPFYAEAGGQVGDTGVVEGEGFLFRVTDTGKIGDIWFHKGDLEEADLTRLPETVRAQVDLGRRLNIMANHTVTHLLHWALHEHVSAEANQQGSLVHPDYMRFDFTYDRALTSEQLETLERAVNERIAADYPLEISMADYDDAIAEGVTALFGEKYSDRVRVVRIGDFSKELCGGTHCRSTGQIGFFRIVQERAVSAGVRRIVSETRSTAVKRALDERRTLQAVARLLNTSPAEVIRRVEQLQAQLQELKKGPAGKGPLLDIKSERKRLLGASEKIGGVSVVVAQLEGVGPKRMGELADALRGGTEPVAGVLASCEEEKVFLLAFASTPLADEGRVHAGKLVSEAAAAVGGKGGGRPDFAKGGGKDPSALQAALEQAKHSLQKALEG